MFGEFLSFAGPIIGGFMADKAADERQEANLAHQAEMNAANAALQREFAQKGIRWKVKDARKAGLHPLAVLGSQTIAAQPSYVAADPGEARTGFASGLQRGLENAAAQLSVQDKRYEVEASKVQVEIMREELDALRRQREREVIARWDAERGPAQSQKDWTDIQHRNSEINKLIAEIRALERGPEGTAGNPKNFRQHYRDPVTGRIFLAPHEEFSEAFDNWVGRGAGAYLEGTRKR